VTRQAAGRIRGRGVTDAPAAFQEQRSAPATRLAIEPPHLTMLPHRAILPSTVRQCCR